MRADNDVIGLLKVLGKSDDICDEEIRIRIAGDVEEALEDIGRRTTEPFIKALRDEDAFARSGAAWQLGNIKDTSTVQPLIEALKDEDISVRGLAVAALGDIGCKEAIDPIRMISNDDDEFIKAMVTEALQCRFSG